MMKPTKLKIALIAGLLAVAAVASLRSTTARTQPAAPDSPGPGVDTSNEERVIGKYLDDLFRYQTEVWTVNKRQVVRDTDINPLQRKSADLQNRLSEVQNAARDIIRKLKATNEFNDLDSVFLSRVSDPRRRAFFQETSFKEDLEYVASNLSSHKDEISFPLEGLRKRVARNTLHDEGSATFVMAAYNPPTTVVGVGLGCRIGQLRLKLIERNGGNISNSPATCDAISCACRPGSGGLCTGSPCSGGAATE